MQPPKLRESDIGGAAAIGTKGEPTAAEAAEEVENRGDGPPLADPGEAPNFDEAAEAAFLAEARERGEIVTTTKAAPAAVEEVVDPKALPPLDELVKRIPPEVRESLDELFRARFVSVRRVPAKALKS